MTNVLLVEDNPDLLASISLELEMNGFQVDQASDGQQAIDFLSAAISLPDIIVSDIAMPNINGYELLATCQRNEQWNGIPFIFLTALGERKDVLVGKKMGADDYLVKPFRPDELIVAIRNKLKRVEQIKVGAERKLDKTRKDLLTLISHELRTPLSAIYGGTELLADSLSNVPDPMSRRMLDLVQSGAKRMRRLVEQIILLTQLDSGSLTQSLEKIATTNDMKTIIERAYGLLEEEWKPEPAPAKFNFYFPSDPVLVRGNTDFLVMMISEGLRNAVAFTPANEPIEVELTHDDEYGYVVITDRGAGIPENEIPNVWKRFVQINRNKFEQQGMGLGLALARESAHLHNGDCFIESVVGKGTRYIVKLPLIPA